LNAARAEARANEARLAESRPAANAPGTASRPSRRSVADELAGEDRSEAERELLKALQSAR
jgi:hypothetical protein